MKQGLVKSLICITLLISATACQEQKKVSSDVEAVRAVKLFTVLESATKVTRTFPGQSASSSTLMLSFPVAGQLSLMAVSVADEVEKGELLAKLDDASFILDQRVAEAEFKKAKASYAEKKSDYDRKVPLAEKGWIARNDLVQSESAMESAKQQVSLMRAKVNLAKNKVEDTLMKAPFSGVISERLAERHEQVSAGQQVISMEGNGAIEVHFSIPERLLSKVVLGQVAEVKFNALGALFAARVTEVASKADTGSLFKIKVSLLAPPPSVKSGMSAEVSLNIGHSIGDQYFLIPLTSIMAGDRQTKSYVYVFEEDSLLLKKRAVLVAKVSTSDNFIAVTGVKAGEEVVSAGVSFLSDGLQVTRY